ncbi:hypothetical protein GCM10023172_16190 [Hymenobacter ginsengisoli]|uniref:Uncharacterized protein n=1 Tax=Hymenobacter ginsengisoli TaxID=1051626 RepID=A0ABP8Q7D7_9BACT
MALANGKGLVLVGVGFEGRLKKQVAWHGAYGRQHPLVANAAPLAQQIDESPALAPVAVRVG